MKIITYFVILLLLSINLYSQDQNLNSFPLSIGIIGGINSIQNQTTINVIPMSSDCGTFQNGSAKAVYAQVFANLDIFQKIFYIDGRLFYESRPISLQTMSSGYEVFNYKTNNYEPLVRQHSFDGDLKYFGVDFGVLVKPIKEIPINFRIGFEAGEPLISAKYVNKEQIVSPEGILFPGDVLVRNVEVGEFNKANTAMSINSTVQGEYAITEKLSAIGEFTYRSPINSVLSDLEWKNSLYRFGIGLQYKLYDENPEVIELPKDTLVPPPIIVVKAPEPNKQEKQIEEIKITPLEITETIVTQTYPLLPYVFFDSASAELKPQYVSNLNRISFSEEKLSKQTLDIYYRMLDILGNRMNKYPNSKIEITGVTDGIELQSKEERLSLASQRANTISEYLNKVWEIPRERMTLKSRETPQKATSSAYNEGFQENRRIEINTNFSDLMKPVYHSKFLEFTSHKTNIEMNIKSQNANLLNEFDYDIFIYADNFPIYNGKGKAKNNNIEIPLTFELMNKIGNQKENLTTLKAEIKLKKGDYSESESVDIKYNKFKNQFEVGRLNLIVFDFDKSDITHQNQEMLKDFINFSILPTSTTKITGSTDRLGEENHNMQLSLNRANSVKDFILNLKTNFKIDKVEGIGSSQSYFSNLIPEGRFYCRTVLIEVQTPLNK
ncbi:MAG: OmpA family protein [Candidatus Kapabacteria bacterium]|nr:OmpA family protein [Candidatus Kapabacteria bacterium]